MASHGLGHSRPIQSRGTPPQRYRRARSLGDRPVCLIRYPLYNKISPYRLFAPCMDDSQLSSSLNLWHWVEVAAMYPGSVRSACCRPTMNIREWVPHQSHGLSCPWCKAGLAHHGPTVLSSNLSLLKQPLEVKCCSDVRSYSCQAVTPDRMGTWLT